MSGEYIGRQVLRLLSYAPLGSFNVIFLYILAFNTRSRQINVIGRTDALGPHQYLARNAATDRLYTTTWAWPPSLSSWYIDWNEWAEEQWFPTLEHLNTIPISEIWILIPCSTQGPLNVHIQ